MSELADIYHGALNTGKSETLEKADALKQRLCSGLEDCIELRV